MQYLKRRTIFRHLCRAGAGVVLLFHAPVLAATPPVKEVVSLATLLLVPGPLEYTAQKPAQTIQIGEASWYGPRFQGKVTASGEVYNQHDLTAAHPLLPGGSTVEVTNLENGRSVRVRINDRGPFAAGCIIDVSQKAAQVLGMLEKGRVPVRLRVLSRPE